MDDGNRTLMLAAVLTVVALAIGLVVVGISNNGGLDSMRTDHEREIVVLEDIDDTALIDVDGQASVGIMMMPDNPSVVWPGGVLMYYVEDTPGDNRHVSSMTMTFYGGAEDLLITDYEPDTGTYQSAGITVTVNNESLVGSNYYSVTYDYSGPTYGEIAGPIGVMSIAYTDSEPDQERSISGTLSVTIEDNGLLPESDRYTYDIVLTFTV